MILFKEMENVCLSEGSLERAQNVRVMFEFWEVEICRSETEAFHVYSSVVEGLCGRS